MVTMMFEKYENNTCKDWGMGWVLLMELYTLLEKMVSQDSLVSL
jgi:hypothetical protein